MPFPTLSYFTLKSLAMQEGIDIFGVTSPIRLIEDEAHLNDWQERGFAGDMKYMQRSAEILSNPLNLMVEAQSIIICGVNYQSSPHPERPSGYGRVARYAWGRDYHQVLPTRLKLLMSRISEACNVSPTYKVFTDAVPLLERAIAKRAGLGFIGKNSMLIRPKKGSFFFITEVLSNLVISDLVKEDTNASCGECQRCRPACPTEAIVSDFKIDSRRCISYLTIEKRGSFDLWEREALSEWIFGCDICQEVCPFNHTLKKRDSPPTFDELSAKNGFGPLLSLSHVLQIKTNREFNLLFAGTPLTRPGRVGLIRNALCVAANTNVEQLTDQIAFLFENDHSSVIRQHALWAIFKIFNACNNLKKEKLISLFNSAYKDNDELVRQEAVRLNELGYV